MKFLAHVLFFSILAISTGAFSYRKIHTFIENKFPYLKRKFKLKWKSVPSYCVIRNIIHGVSAKELERAFRKYSLFLAELKDDEYYFVNLDGKTLRGSFDNFKDEKAVQVFSAFLTGNNIILAHEEIHGQKTNEIPIAQDLIKNLGLEGCVFTGDAMHCQKKLLKQ